MDTKQDDLLQLARVLEDSGQPWALIGGLAYQIHAAEPRTTLDIDVAISSREKLPGDSLRAAGFEPTGTFPYTENWRGPGGAPVQFSDDPEFAAALRGAEVIDQGGVTLRVISKLEFIRAKLRAAAAPQRRRSKAMRDLVDVETLLEEDPSLEPKLDAHDRGRRDLARRRIAEGD